jgi:hypothetical protein
VLLYGYVWLGVIEHPNGPTSAMTSRRMIELHPVGEGTRHG